MSLFQQLANTMERPASRHGPVQCLVVLIEDELLDMPFGWGPEIEELGERLARVAMASGDNRYDGVQQVSSGYWLSFHSSCPEELTRWFSVLLEQSPMAAAASLHVAGGVPPSKWRRVWPSK